jgi:hypothetical protein
VASLLDHARAVELCDDATAKIGIYQQLSHRYAAQADSFHAVMSAWAADLYVVQALLWERGLKASPRPDSQFFTVGAAVSRALAQGAAAQGAPSSARQPVEAARKRLMAVFDPTVHGLLADRFIALDHLDELPHPAPAAGVQASRTRLAGRSVTDLVAELQMTAKDCSVIASELRSVGRDEDALRQAYISDMASFEAYLLEAANRIDDTSLVTVDLRWSAATAAISALPGLPADVVAAVAVIRDQLSSVLGPIEAARLSSYLLPIE